MKEIARTTVINRERLLHHLLKNEIELKVAYTDWHTPGDAAYEFNPRLKRINPTIHYVELGRNEYGILDFEESASGLVEEAVIWVDDSFSRKRAVRKIKRAMGTYDDSQHDMDAMARADLLTMEAICHHDASTKESFKRAIAVAKKALETNPRLGRAWNCQGAAWANLKEPHKAIRYYIKAIRVEPDLLRPWVNLGNRYADLGDNLRSLLAYRIATRFKPKINGDFDVLQKAYRKLKRLNDTPREIKLLLSQRTSDLNQLIIRHSSAPSSVDLRPPRPLSARRLRYRTMQMEKTGRRIDEEGHEMTLYDMALALARLDRPEEALDCCERLLQEEPGHPGALETRVVLLMTLKRTVELLAACNEASVFKEENPGIIWIKALTEDGLRMTDEAAATYWRFISLAGEEEQKYKNYALRRLQEFAYWRGIGIDSQENGTPIQAEEPQNQLPMDTTRKLPLIEAREKHIFDLLRPSYSLMKEPSHSGLKEGMLMIVNGLWRSALGLFEEITSNEPDNARAAHFKAYCQMHLGLFDDAQRVTNALLEKHPDQSDAYAVKAELHLERALAFQQNARASIESATTALDYLTKATTIDGRNAYVLYLKALIEDALHQRNEAFKTFCQFLVVRPGDDGYHATYAKYRLRELAAIGVDPT